MKQVKAALLVGAMCVPMWMAVGCGDGAKERSGVHSILQNAKYMCNDLKATFESGAATKSFGQGRDLGRPDIRMDILRTQLKEKIRSTVERKESDATKRDAILAKVKEATEYMTTEIIPKYQKATQSNKPEDAKALVPLMEELDKKLDEINALL